jgi:hypothetical protein
MAGELFHETSSKQKTTQGFHSASDQDKTIGMILSPPKTVQCKARKRNVVPVSKFSQKGKYVYVSIVL